MGQFGADVGRPTDEAANNHSWNTSKNALPLSETQEANHDDQPSATSSTTPSQPTKVPKAVNANPQPEHAAEWEEKVKGWP
jgi:hypothetical protein